MDSRVLTGLMFATALGWMVFEPYLLAATGLEDEDEAEVQRRAKATMLRLLVETT